MADLVGNLRVGGRTRDLDALLRLISSCRRRLCRGSRFRMLLGSDFELSENFNARGEDWPLRFLGGLDPSTFTAFSRTFAGMGVADGALFEDRKFGMLIPKNFFLGLFAPSSVFFDAPESFDALLVHVSCHSRFQFLDVMKYLLIRRSLVLTRLSGMKEPIAAVSTSQQPFLILH